MWYGRWFECLLIWPHGSKASPYLSTVPQGALQASFILHLRGASSPLMQKTDMQVLALQK